MPNTPTWEERFDKEFGWFHRPDSSQFKTIDTWDMAEDLKYFISKLIIEAKEEERIRIKEMIKEAWRFDNNQRPISTWHDKEDFIESLTKE